MKGGKTVREFFTSKTFSLLLIVVVLMALFTALTDGAMVAPLNIRNIFKEMVIMSFLGVGAAILMLSGDIDLSAGAIGSFAGCILALGLTESELPSWFCYVLALLTGAACGLVNAFLVNALHFQSFIATLCTSSVLGGTGFMLIGGQGLKVKGVALLNWLGDTKLLDGLLPVTVIISLAFIVVYGVILARTRFGRSIYLCGGNRNAAYLSGLYPTRLSYILFMNSGFLAAISGCVYVSQVKTAYANSITSYQFTGLTASILGGVSFMGGAGGMGGCFLGMLVLSVFYNGVTTMGIDYNYRTIFNGLLLVGGLSLDAVNARRRVRQVLKQSLVAASPPSEQEG
ncbi:MAG: ABC transporter permease [Oscillospiraceae bacterium]|jgi:ribose/xylose/arabinose/galactoside ABC-type transport system permease subunit|nr:ABC transporter permease [Oscillospiraceae bacterium]